VDWCVWGSISHQEILARRGPRQNMAVAVVVVVVVVVVTYFVASS